MHAEANTTASSFEWERQLLRTLIDRIPDLIFVKDASSRFILANLACARQLGMASPAEVVGKSDADFVEPHLAQAYLADEQALMASGKTVHQEEPTQHKETGRVGWSLTTKLPLRDDRGGIIGLMGIARDITERKQAEAELREAEATLARERNILRALIDSLPDLIFVKNDQSRFLMVNQACAQQLGINRPEAVIGKTDADFVKAELAAQYRADEQAIMASGQGINKEEPTQHRQTGAMRWSLTTKVPFRNAEGQVTGLVGIARDITERKRAEEEVHRAKEALEIANRQLISANHQLEEAIERANRLAIAAEAANQAKSVFLANMSHEIRTPMNGVVGMTNLLLETSLSEEQRDFAETVRSSADSLLVIINDILDFSKIEADKLILETLDYDLQEVVDGTLELLAERASGKSLELASLIERNVPTRLRGDPGRLRQILMNLVGNAIKFTEVGEVFVEVTKAQESATHVDLRVAIHDSGAGIDSKTQQRLFQAFTQADSSTTRRYGGTGLGLAISQRLAELMGGRIGVESELGRGSTFWFTVAMEKQLVAENLATSEPPRLAQVKALVVDDNAVNRKILRYQLQGWNLQGVECATSAAEALVMLRSAAAEGAPYNVALLDYQMPETDGLMLARQIKADPSISATRLLMLTSMCQRMEPAKLKEAQVEAWLVKPVKPKLLYQHLCQIMSSKETGSAVSVFREGGAHPGIAPLAMPTAAAIKVLLAEDNPVNQKVAIRQLRKLGLSVDAVGNGREVLTEAKRIAYDVILMDCVMPELDGYEATRQIRSGHYGNPGVHIIAMTANAMQGDREKCLAAGMNDYVSKPVLLEDLRTALERYIKTIAL